MPSPQIGTQACILGDNVVSLQQDVAGLRQIMISQQEALHAGSLATDIFEDTRSWSFRPFTVPRSCCTGTQQPGTLQISPDGKIGASGSHSSQQICLFDIPANRFLGTVAAGTGHNGFFDRDVGFSQDRSLIFVTNPPDKTMIAIDVLGQQLIGHINLPAQPDWMKVLTV